jgi:hypothetical protein
MGMTLAEIGEQPEEIVPAKYLIEKVPKPHSAFEKYVLQITPKCGLSWIKAIGHTIQTSVYGIELQTAFESMEKKLSAIYGKGEKTDGLLPDSIWNAPKEWMQSYLRKERHLMTEWSSGHGSTIADSLSSVRMGVFVYDTNSGYIAIEYSFENIASAEAEKSSAEDDAL